MWGAKTDNKNDNSARLWQVNFIDTDNVINPILLDIWETIKNN